MAALIAQLRDRSRHKPNLKQHGKKVFWGWIAYQTIKGTLTTSLIWVPLFLAYWNH
jgi:hypothetical protein